MKLYEVVELCIDGYEEYGSENSFGVFSSIEVALSYLPTPITMHVPIIIERELDNPEYRVLVWTDDIDAVSFAFNTIKLTI